MIRSVGILSLAVCLASHVVSAKTSGCSESGFRRHESDCSLFYRCKDGKTLTVHPCPDGLLFNEQTSTCDWPENVPDCAFKKGKHGKNHNGKLTTVSDLGSLHWANEDEKHHSAHHPLNHELHHEAHHEVPHDSHHEVNHEPHHTTDPKPHHESSTPASTHLDSTTKAAWEVEWSPSMGPTTAAEPPPRGGLSDEYKVVCYFSNWAWYRPDEGKFIPEDINPHFCTHINYAFAVLDDQSLTIKVHDSWADVDNRFLKRFVALREKNPKLKIILALGGWNDSAGDKYSRLVNSASARRKFVKHAIAFLDSYGFDGLDLDWEYPKCWQTECNRGPESDKEGFAHLAAELHAVLHPQGRLLTAAVSPSKMVIDAAYDVPSLARSLDFINLMAYDYHGAWDKFAEHHAPLYSRPQSKSFDPHDGIFNINYTVNHWMHRGMPSHKIILGVPFYGRSFALDASRAHEKTNETRAMHGYGVAVKGGGEPGKFSREKGYLAYYEVCQVIKSEHWTKHRDPHAGPYAISDKEWVGYDDATQLLAKTSFIKAKHLGGAMIWAIDLDDFRGLCCGIKYPLLKTLNRGLRGYASFNVKALGCP